ncbi:MAG: hypothetical protein JWP63_3173 [Candidatus Solibacter sp.]|nr:hypothetical protein [Candidatus Solibacter sp.]
MEVGFNYGFTRVNLGNTAPAFTQNGGSGYVEYNINKVVGLVADLGAYHNGDINSFQIDNTTFTYLFGPRFNWRMSKVTLYTQTLVGGARTSASYTPTSGTTPVTGHQNGFATALGGGMDIALSHLISVKPIQLEYLMTQDPNPFTQVNHIQNDLRYSAGIVLKFGAK